MTAPQETPLLLYHTGFSRIPAPDLTVGRRNADFGQGFYLSDDGAFSRRWARTRKGQTTYLNRYTLDLAGLSVMRFDRDRAWYDYIFANRAGREDALAAFDVIVGPIANDTLYDTWGLLTSGLLPPETALRLLCVGPLYRQTVVKTEKAARALRFLGAEPIPETEIEAFRAIVREEEARFQAAFAETIESLPDLADA